MPPFHSTFPQRSESGYILILCMIFIILISLSFASLMQILEHYQRLNTEFKMNTQVLVLEPDLKTAALQQTIAKNLHVENPIPSPITQPNWQTQQNEIHLRAIQTTKDKTLNIWQAWFFLHDPTLPITALFEAKIRCLSRSNLCQIIQWHRSNK